MVGSNLCHCGGLGFDRDSTEHRRRLSIVPSQKSLRNGTSIIPRKSSKHSYLLFQAMVQIPMDREHEELEKMELRKDAPTCGANDVRSCCFQQVACEDLPDVISSCDESESDSDSSPHFHHQSRLQPTCGTGRRVQFSSVETRFYSITLGDHPLASMYPLSLDWAYTSAQAQTIEDHEATTKAQASKKPKISPGCGIKAQKLPVTERMERLMNVTGKNSRQLFMLEQKRQLLLREEGVNIGVSRRSR